jgi:hypothetical protein
LIVERCQIVDLSKAGQLALGNGAGFGGDKVAQAIGGVIAAGTVVVSIDLEDVFGAIGVVLEGGETFDEAGAALVDEEFWGNAVLGIAEAMEDFGPAVDTVGVGAAQSNPEPGVLGSDGGAVTLRTKDVRAGDEAA